jgi:phosphoglycolate phosphatase
MTRIKLVAFDLDGTLVDSAPDLARAVDTALRELGLPEPGVEEVRAWVGDGVTRLMQRALIFGLGREPGTAQVEEALKLFSSAYRQHVAVDSRLYPDTLATLETLKRSDYRLVCVTNKSEEFTVPLLQALGILAQFDLVLSGDSLPARKPDPLPLLHAAERFQLKPAQCCMVGDSRNDILAARAAGFVTVAMVHGYHQGEDLAALGAEALLESFRELPAFLASAGPGLAR